MQIFFRGLCALVEWVGSDPQTNGRFTVILPATEMDAGRMGPGKMAMHHAALSVPVNAYSNASADPACIVPTGLVPSTAQWQPYGIPAAIWDLQGRALTIALTPPDPAVPVKKDGAMAYRSLDFVPSLADANEGDDWIDPRYMAGGNGAVDARVELIGGSIMAELPAHPMMTTKKWQFGLKANVGYTDQVSYTAAPANMYTLVLTDLKGARDPIEISLNADAKVFVTHLPQDATKEHFRAYWDLLTHPNGAKPVPEDGQAIQLWGQRGSYPGDCLNAYGRFKA